MKQYVIDPNNGQIKEYFKNLLRAIWDTTRFIGVIAMTSVVMASVLIALINLMGVWAIAAISTLVFGLTVYAFGLDQEPHEPVKVEVGPKSEPEPELLTKKEEMDIHTALKRIKGTKLKISSHSAQMFAQRPASILYWLLESDCNPEYKAEMLTEIHKAIDWTIDENK